MPLSPIVRGERGNSYCGPAAIACVYGTDPDTAARQIRQVTGKVKVFGLWVGEMAKTLKKLGGATKIESWPAGSLVKVAALLQPGIYVVAVTGHYVAIDTTTGEVCDNHTIYPMALSRYSRRGRHVKAVWRIDRA